MFKLSQLNATVAGTGPAATGVLSYLPAAGTIHLIPVLKTGLNSSDADAAAYPSVAANSGVATKLLRNHK